MATIGSFTRTTNGFTGTIRTLTLNAKVTIVRDENKTSETTPDYRVLAANTVELGAGWKKIAKTGGREYISLKLDDPSFPAAIYANLIQTEATPETFTLIWSR